MNSPSDRFPIQAVLVALMLGFGPGYADAQDTAPSFSAVSRIEALLNEVEGAKQTLLGRVDYASSTGVLIDSMRKAGVSEIAIDKYAKDWAQGYIYLSWSWVQPFYDSHAQALSESLARVRRIEAIPVSDVEYLERGMGAWRGAEGEIQLLFDQLFQALVQRGTYLGRSLELSDRKFAESECCGPEWDDFNARIQEEDIHAAESSIEARYASTTVREYGSQRYFSAIDPVEEFALAEEINVTSDDEEVKKECEEDPLEEEESEELGDVLHEIQAAYDASEASSFEFLGESEEKFNQRRPPFAEQAE